MKLLHLQFLFFIIIVKLTKTKAIIVTKLFLNAIQHNIDNK